MELTLPHNFTYRPYQKDIVNFVRNGWKRAVLLYHRRGGKDKTMWNLTVEMAVREVWGYAYVLPTYAQWKKIIWDSIDKDGNMFRSHIPPQLIESENSQELKINLKNGSFIQILGSENIDGLRGISPRGIVFSEYAFQNPTAWEVMRPILAENGGWAIFNSTPNGKNHFFELYNMAKDNENWFTQRLTVDDTWMVKKEYIDEERRNGMSEEMVMQEYYVSFDVGAIGSYYGREMEEARADWRIAKLPFNKDVPLDLYFDLWVNDSFTISFKQNDGQFFNFVNYYEDTGKTLEYYFSYIDDYIQEKRAKLGKIYLPHDSKQKSHGFLVSGITIYEKFVARYWAHKVEFIKNEASVNDGIQEVRKLFPRIRFDVDACNQLIKAIDNYKKDWDDTKKIFRDNPRHDWASHWADNLRYFWISKKDEVTRPKPKIYFPSYSWIN